MTAIPDLEPLEDLWTDKLSSVEGVRSTFSVGQIEELGNERIFKMPAAVVMHAGMPANPPRVIGGPVEQEGTMTWSIFVIAESMRSTSKRGGAQTVGRKILESVIGWDIVEGWTVYLVDFRQVEIPGLEDASVVIYEIVVAHPYDLTGN